MNVFILEFRWQSLRQWQFVGFVGSTPETWFWSEVWLHSALGSLKKQTDTILLLLKPWKRCEPKNPGMSLPNFKTTRLIAIIAGKKWATAINLPFISIYPWLGMVSAPIKPWWLGDGDDRQVSPRDALWAIWWPRYSGKEVPSTG